MSDGEIERPVEARAVPSAVLVRTLLMVLIAASLLVGLHVYIGTRLIVGLGLSSTGASVAWLSVWAMFGSIFLGFIGGRLLPRPAAKVAQGLGFVWMGAFGLLLASLAVSDAMLWVVGLTTTVPPEWVFARSAVVLTLVVAALAWGFFVARAPSVRRVTVDIKGLHADLDGFKVVQLSDVHITHTLDRRFAELLAKMVNSLEADAVVITGDLVDGTVDQLRHDVAPLGTMKSRHGTYFVTGNHEYYSGAEVWMHEVSRLGMTVLHNEHRVLKQGEGELVLGGVPDFEGSRFAQSHRPDVVATFRGAPAGVPRLLLAHQPRFARAARNAEVSLMLSGHTHAGQIFPFNLFVKLQQPVVAGFHHIEGVPTYTSSGTGYWGPPFRVGTRGEVTEITLRRV